MSKRQLLTKKFLFITITGFIFTRKCGKTDRCIPLLCYVKMTLLYAFNVLFQNILLHLQFDIPLQQLLRSGTLIANLVLSVTMLNKKYCWSKYVSILMISAGIALATLASTDCVTRWKAAVEGSVTNQLYVWLLGIAALLVGFYMSAYMGIYQEIVFGLHGKHSNEALFYNHALVLPFFVFFSKDIVHYIVTFSQSERVVLPLIHLYMPKLWLYLIINVFTHYVCVSSVFSLTAQCSSLTVNLVLTLRKFISLLVSVVYFSNDFTAVHWLGTLLVFSGTLLFTASPDPAGSNSSTNVCGDIHDELPALDDQCAVNDQMLSLPANTVPEHGVRRRPAKLELTGSIEYLGASSHAPADGVSATMLQPVDVTELYTTSDMTVREKTAREQELVADDSNVAHSVSVSNGSLPTGHCKGS